MIASDGLGTRGPLAGDAVFHAELHKQIPVPVIIVVNVAGMRSPRHWVTPWRRVRVVGDRPWCFASTGEARVSTEFSADAPHQQAQVRLDAYLDILQINNCSDASARLE